MRFSSISIRNYRQYKALDLEFSRGPHDLTVIIGDNGTGKTNLLNAFTWCLYGTEPHLGSKDKTGEPRLNKEVLLEAYHKGIGIEDVSVSIDIEDGENIVRVQRKVPFRITGSTSCVEKTHEQTLSVVIIHSDGIAKDVSYDMREVRINKLLPESIREYFFFDGEQLNNYFSDTRTENIKAAVYSISQISDVSQMKQRTKAVVDALRREFNKEAPDLSEAQRQIDRLQGIRDQYAQKVTEAEEQSGELKRKIEELDERLRGVPNVEELEVKRDSLKRQHKSAEQSLESARGAYYRFARERYADFAFYKLAVDVLDAIHTLEKDNQLPPAIDSGYLETMLKAHQCDVCKRPLSEVEEQHLRDLLERFRVSSETSNILTGLRGELKNLVRRVERYASDRDEKIRMLSSAKSLVTEISDELKSVEANIAGCPDAPQVKEMFELRESYETARASLDKQIGEYTTKKTAAVNQLPKYEKQYADIKKRIAKNTDLKRTVDFGSRAIRILEEVEHETMEEVRTWMARETESLFRGLVWKESKCEHIELNENYQLSLYDRLGFSCAVTCSAAERALLALSFTLAMHEVSGFDTPLFIDTPIARASGENRTNFAETLAEVSKTKQLILTFTPDEYSESIANVFNEIAASRMRLVLDEDERSVVLCSEG